MRGTSLFAISLFLLLPTTYSFAHFTGTTPDPKIAAAVQALTDREGKSCCNEADFYPEPVWGHREDGGYWIEIGGKRFDVPDRALIQGPTPFAYAVAWYVPPLPDHGKQEPYIHCFKPGFDG